MKKLLITLLIIVVLSISLVQPAFAIDDAADQFFPNITSALWAAMAAGAVLVASTVFQVGDQVNAGVETTKTVARAVFATVEADIQEWWDSLTAEDQIAFEEKVHNDDNLTVAEALPSSIIASAIASSLQYENPVNLDDLQTYRLINSTTYGVMVISNDEYLHLYQMDNDINYSLSKLYWYRYNDDWVLANALDGATYTLTLKDNMVFKYTIAGIWEYYNTPDHDSNSWYDPSRIVMFESYDSVLDGPMTYYTSLKGTIDSAVALDSAYANWNPDNQQTAPFYYPVDSLSIGSAVDTTTATDEQLGNIDTFFPAVSSAEWDYTAGSSADTSIPLAYDSATGTLSDADTGIPVSLGVDAPWTNDTSVGDDTGSGTATWDGDMTVDPSIPGTVELDLTPLIGADRIFDKFPFSIPKDIILVISSLVQERETPVYVIPMDFGTISDDLVVTLTPLDPMFNIARPMILLYMVVRLYFGLARRTKGDEEDA